MQINITVETCKKVLDNPSSTEMEKILANYAMRLHYRIGKVENDNNDLKGILKSIAARFFSNCPWILEQEAKNHNFIVTEQNAEIKDAV